MTRCRLALAAFIVLVPALAAAAETPPRSGNAVFDRTVDVVNQHFFAPSELPKFNEAATLAVSQMPGLKDADPAVVGDAVSFLLDSLHAPIPGATRPTSSITTSSPMSSALRCAATCAGCSRRKAK